jgi:hypothetical protein
MTLLSIHKLEDPPLQSKKASAYVWADYIELLCLCNIDRQVSKADILDRIQESQDLGDIEEFVASDWSDEDSLPRQADENLDELDFFSGEPRGEFPTEDNLSIAERDDLNMEQADIWFEHLRYREEAFGDCYPFRVRQGMLVCKDGIENDHRAKLYIFLLSSSCLKYFSPHHHYFTYRFEVVSLVALKSYLPKDGRVSFIGTNPLNSGIYKGNVWHKIQTLSREIGDPVSSRWNEECFPRDSGDRGLDVMARIPIGDSLPGYLLLFGQCACGKKWTEKRLEPHTVNWGTYIEFTVDPTAFLFIPYCFRHPDGRWYDLEDVQQTVIVDRQRLLYLLDRKLSLLKRLDLVGEPIDALLDYVEPMV